MLLVTSPPFFRPQLMPSKWNFFLAKLKGGCLFGLPDSLKSTFMDVSMNAMHVGTDG